MHDTSTIYDTPDIVIIHHTDMDGWLAGYICMYHELLILNKMNLEVFSWSYGRSTQKIEQCIDSCKDLRRIYVVDVTLPDEFMSKYAEKIIWIDHHKSSIEIHKEWMDRLDTNYSAIAVDEYNGINGKQAAQISACELCWLHFFGSFNHNPDPMPKAVYLAGRYDVWDLNDDVLNFNAYVNTRVRDKKYHDRIFEPWIKESLDDKNIPAILEEGRTIRNVKTTLNAIDSNANAVVATIFGKKIAITNSTTFSSQYFDTFVKEHPGIDGLMVFNYSFMNRQWRVSCYENYNGFDALNFIQNYKDKIPNIVSMGGHKGACGFSFTTEGIQQFLECIEKVEKGKD